MYIVNYLLTQYGQPSKEGQEVTNLLDNLEFIVLPFVNPDGYSVSKKKSPPISLSLSLSSSVCLSVSLCERGSSVID